MIKKNYYINGFDCANCARKTEEYLSKHPNIENVRIDFSRNRLYISFVNEEMSSDEIKKIISEVESENIVIKEENERIPSKNILTKELINLIIKVAFGLLVIILSFTIFKSETLLNFWMNFSLYLLALIFLTSDIIYKVFLHIIHKENPLDEYLLITLAVVGSFLVATINKESHDFMESAMVVMLFQIGRVIESIATNRSKEAIMNACDLRVDEAILLTENEAKKVKASSLKINDIVLVNLGEIVPCDGVIISGNALVDVSSLTGEYMPISLKEGEQILSGYLIKRGSLKIQVSKEYKDSTIAKIINLIENSGENKSKADKFITKFARFYTPIVFVCSLLFFFLGGLISKDYANYGLNALKLLVVACPCAIVISVPMAYFSAIGLASKNGIVVKGTNYLDELAKMKKLVTDKTGTLTHGSFSISKVVPFNLTNDDFLHYLYAAESLSSHPIGKAICHNQNLKKIILNVKDFEEITGFGVKCLYYDKTLLAGNIRLMKLNNIPVPLIEDNGLIIYLAVNNIYSGYIVINDEIKEDAEPMVSLLHQENIEIILLTGDKEENTKCVCEKLHIDRYKSGLLPKEKTDYLIEEIDPNHKYATVYIGDGINDAASIKLSDVGIAMGAIGSDVAVNNADVVIMNDDPAKVYDVYKISKMAKNTAIFNVIFALSIKIGIEIITIISTITKAFTVPMVVAVIADTGLTVLLVLNSLFLLYRKVKRKIKSSS